MSDTATVPASKKPRYTGEVTLSGHSDEEPVKASRVDLAEYMEHLRGIPQGMQRGFTLPSGAVSVAKSRFAQAAAKLGIGVRFVAVEHGSSQVRPAWDLQPGHTRLLVSTGAKRQVTRKPKPADAAPKPSGGLASAVKAGAKR